jgi:hypothetical protein
MRNNTGNGIMFGALVTVVMAFPVAGLISLLFRFPIPMCGNASGISAVIPAMIAVLFYGILGGFLLLATIGGLTGAIISHVAVGKISLPWKKIMLACLLIDLAALFVLAILDKIIGPW